jgi:transposase
MNCPKCKSEKKVKDGIVKNRQRYKCKECNYRFTVEERGLSKSLKKDALHLYLEGLGFRSIGRFLNVSHVSVFNWIKAFGKEVGEIKNEESVKIVELDEMHTYVQSKKTIVGSGLLLIDMEKDSSTSLLAVEELKQESDFGKK